MTAYAPLVAMPALSLLLSTSSAPLTASPNPRKGEYEEDTSLQTWNGGEKRQREIYDA